MPDSADSETDETDPPNGDPDPVEFLEEDEIYTLHKNPVFIATKAVYLSLKRPWELAATDAKNMPPALALSYLVSLHRGEEQAVQAIHSLDFGDYAGHGDQPV